ncbi:4'-phosphopantetheinyl transferase family protein [Streptomyces sp. NPDC056500]|uniref:4'-phosphopantetheinyl transferase family protein n=1 Tax=Streptomyces sp. NPDC056500 TaxID=3345840 RepID=UPI0036CE6680
MQYSGTVAHVWCREVADEAATGDGVGVADVEWALSDSERTSRDALRRTQDRAVYGAAWGLVRHALSTVEPRVYPDEWRFLRSSLGRPEVHYPTWARSLRFNLSHTDGIVACVTTRGARCGVDVERPVRVLPLHRLARSVLSEREQREFDLAPPGRRQELFFRYWTVKEAYLKAIGSGMRFPMTACEFAVGSSRPALLSLAAGSEHARYTFRQWPVQRGGLLALAVQGRATIEQESDVTVRVHLSGTDDERPQTARF